MCMTLFWCPAEILKDYEAKLTAGYSESYSKGTNAGVTVNVKDNEHGTVTAGGLQQAQRTTYAHDCQQSFRCGTLTGSNKLSRVPLLLQCRIVL